MDPPVPLSSVPLVLVDVDSVDTRSVFPISLPELPSGEMGDRHAPRHESRREIMLREVSTLDRQIVESCGVGYCALLSTLVHSRIDGDRRVTEAPTRPPGGDTSRLSFKR